MRRTNKVKTGKVESRDRPNKYPGGGKRTY